MYLGKCNSKKLTDDVSMQNVIIHSALFCIEKIRFPFRSKGYCLTNLTDLPKLSALIEIAGTKGH